MAIDPREAEKIIKDVAKVSEHGAEFVAENGVRLQLKKAPRSLIGDALNKMPAPQVPMWHNPDKDRDEPNPNDPTYAQAVMDYTRRQGEMIWNVYMVFGCTVTHVPEDVAQVGESSWVELVQMVSPEVAESIPDTGHMRTLAWLKYYALPGNECQDLYNRIVRLSGGRVMEDDVVDATQTFRGDSEGTTDNGTSAVEQSPSRDSDSVGAGVSS